MRGGGRFAVPRAGSAGDPPPRGWQRPRPVPQRVTVPEPRRLRLHPPRAPAPPGRAQPPSPPPPPSPSKERFLPLLAALLSAFRGASRSLRFAALPAPAVSPVPLQNSSLHCKFEKIQQEHVANGKGNLCRQIHQQEK